MRVLIMESKEPTPRSKVYGWTNEDSDLYVPGQPIGMTPSPRPSFMPDTVLEALHAGYRLLGPPQHYDGEDGWEWWLTKDE
jgi:hypothetical protein